MDEDKRNIIDVEEHNGTYVNVDHERKYTSGQAAGLIHERNDMVNYWYNRFSELFPDAKREEKDGGRNGRIMFSDADLAVLKRIFSLKSEKRTDEYVRADLSDSRTKVLLSPEKSSMQKVNELLGGDEEFQKSMSLLVEAGIKGFIENSGIMDTLSNYKDQLASVGSENQKLLEAKDEVIKEQLSSISNELDQKNKEIDELKKELEEEKKKKRPLFSFGKKD